MKNETALDRLLAVITRPKVYIQTHNYPDQDALASAYGLQELLRYKGIESVICYQGEIDKANTISMTEALGLQLYDVDDLSIQAEDEIILVGAEYTEEEQESTALYFFEVKEEALYPVEDEELLNTLLEIFTILNEDDEEE